MISCNKHLSHDAVYYSKTKVIAHRGFSGIAPENTIAAFQKAINAHADYFELDVHQSKDGKLVVIHDYEVDRTSSNNAKGKISQLTYSELQNVKVGFSEKYGEKYSNEKIPTLKEVLQLAKGKINVCIEIKVHDIEEKVLALINSLGMNDEVIIFSFHYDVLTKIRTLDSKIPILYLIDYANLKTIDYAKLIHANAIGVGYATMPSEKMIKLAHTNGIEIWKWTVNKEEQMKELVNIGLDGIITNFPTKALHITNRHK